MNAALELLLHGPDADEDELGSLRDWLLGEELEGMRVEYLCAKPLPGQMGADLLTGLTIVLGSKAVVALVDSIVAWIRGRKPRLKLKISTSSGTAEIDAENVGGLDLAIQRAVSLLSESG